MSKGYDVKCGDLAQYFLPDCKTEAVAELAQSIQDAIEDWLASDRGAGFSGDDSAPNGGKAAGSVTVSQAGTPAEPDVSQSSIPVTS
jgi:hypothetical protein